MLRPYDVIIIQNPPCLPAVIAASAVSFFNRSTIVIDWHNLGFAMFEERLGKDHLLVRMAFQLERAICRLAHKHICVSGALKDWLAEHFGIPAIILYDRPAKLFVKQAPSMQQRHGLLSMLGYTDTFLFPSLNGVSIGNPSSLEVNTNHIEFESTCQTKLSSTDYPFRTQKRRVGELEMREDGTRMIVSATSWTADEDFSILLDALEGLSRLLTSRSIESKAISRNLNENALAPDRLLVVVTGKGPLKEEFEASVLDRTARGLLNLVAVKTAWLSAEDYSLLLRCADLGVCLHTSTSGLDLPMKVCACVCIYISCPHMLLPLCQQTPSSSHAVINPLYSVLVIQVLDMFGSGLPVCAINFPTLPELVKNGDNGLIFSTAEQLTAQLSLLLYPSISSAFNGNIDSHTDVQLSGQSGCRDDRRGDSGTGVTFNVHDEEISKKCLLENGSEMNLQNLRRGAEKIQSWDDNWHSVLGPEVASWVR